MGPVDKNFYWTAIIYFTGLWLLGVAWWQALIVAFMMSISWYLTYSRRLVSTLGTALLLFGLAVWLGFTPNPREWWPLRTDASNHPPVNNQSAIH